MVSLTLLNSTSELTTSLLLQPSIFFFHPFHLCPRPHQGPLPGLCVFVGPRHEAAGLCWAVRGREGAKGRRGLADEAVRSCGEGRPFSGRNLH